MNEDRLRLRGLHRTFGGLGGVTDVSVTVPSGAIYVLCGSNGAGKTTTLCVLSGLLYATAGVLTLDGRDIALKRYSPRPGMSFLTDTPVVDDELTGWQWLEYVAALKQQSLLSAPLEIADLLLLAPEVLNRPLHAVSFGTRRKVALWTELLTTSGLLLLDEPIIGLDPAAIEGLYVAMRQFVLNGRSIMLSSHLLRDAEQFATHVGIVSEGRSVADGTVQAVCGGRSLVDTYMLASASERP